MMKKRYFLPLIAAGVITASLLLLTFTPFQAKTPVDRETMARSNQLYENGRFSEAAQTYQQLVDLGFEDSALFYNLGNTYYKLGDTGRAILNYERAARLAPRDGDIQNNLDFARSLAVDKYEIQADTPLEQWVQITSSLFTVNELSLLALGAFWLLAIVWILYRHRRGMKSSESLQLVLVLSLLFFALSAFTLGGRLYMDNNSPQAIVLAENIDVLSGPGEDYITEFSLHSGAKVNLLETRGQWARLALPGDQFQGWAPLEAVETLD